MMKHLLSISFLFLGLNVFSQAFSALYPFSAVTTTSGVNDPTPPPTATGVTFGSFSAVGVGANSSGGGRFSFNSWSTGATTGVDTYSTMTGAIDLTDYYEVAITPSVGYGVTLTKIDFDVRRSTTGIRNFSARSSADGYATNIPCAVIFTQTNISVPVPGIFFWNFDATSTAVDQKGCIYSPTGSGYTNFTSPLTVRFYAWNAEAGTGTFSLDSVIFTGSATFGAGIADVTHNLNASFTIYPNPSNDGIIYLDTKKINYNKIEVVNILGSIVAIENKESATNEKIKLNLNTLPSGTYFIRVTSVNKIYTERFFITK
jgi:hypothetical protein